jgi:NAD(P)-dependent dehydrogenase (short-subunit alcohol dehydrogenase family)
LFDSAKRLFDNALIETAAQTNDCHELQDWAGRIALVTGASRGIGRAVAKAIARRGGRVALVGRDAAALAETAAACPGALVVEADVTSAADIAAVADRLEALGDRLDLLANVAGAPGRALALEALTDDDWADSLRLNLLAAVRLQRACLPALSAAQGCIVNVGSIAAAGGMRNGAAYAAAKAALASVTRTAAVEWARRGIRANLVEPGYVATDFNAPLLEAGLEPRILAKVPTGRPIAPEAVADAVLHLGSPQQRDVTGATLRVDGGWTARL